MDVSPLQCADQDECCAVRKAKVMKISDIHILCSKKWETIQYTNTLYFTLLYFHRKLLLTLRQERTIHWKDLESLVL